MNRPKEWPLAGILGFEPFTSTRFPGSRHDQLVFVDESGTDRRIGFRKTGWSPLGIAPVQRQALARGERYQILPAYTSEGVLAASHIQRRHGHIDIRGLSGEYFASEMRQISSEELSNCYG